jgi:hypothetical protein
MQVFVLVIGWCVLSAEFCGSENLHHTNEGVFESKAECDARGDFLTKGKPRPRDYGPSSKTSYCEPWTLTRKGSPLSREGPADPWKHTPTR